MTGVKFSESFLSSVNFTDTNLTNADFDKIQVLPNGLIPQNNIFIRANLTSANFAQSILHEANFTDANLQNADFSNALLRRVKFTSADNVSTANFSGATFEEVTCPDGTNSDNNNSSCEGHY